jgi:hypothetical protein
MTGRRLLTVCSVLVLGALALDPNRPRIALGVLGGGVLAGLSYWGIRGGVDALVSASTPGESGHGRAGAALVKFFTRHAILAVAAYGMMARLHLDPIGMLIGVSALAVAAGADWAWPSNAPRKL